MNTSTLNSFVLNGSNPPFVLTASDFDMLEFDGFSLQNDNVITEEMDIFSPPKREIVDFRIPRNDGLRMNGNYLRERRVQVKGHLRQSTSSLMETAIKEFKRRLMPAERNLDLKIDEQIQRVTATLSNPEQMFNRRKGWHITTCPFDLEFLVLDPFFHDLEYSYITRENNVALTLAETVENLGTAYARPVVIVIIEAAVAVTALRFQNATNSKQITATTSLVAGDVLIFDSEESVVTKNGVEIDYSGIFPTLEYGSNNCSLVTTGTSVQYTSTIAYKKSYF